MVDRVAGVLAKRHTARRRWICGKCGKDIAWGDTYLYVNAFYPYRACLAHADRKTRRAVLEKPQ